MRTREDMTQQTTSPVEDAWNPGLQSDIPAALWPLVTLFREENASVSHAMARELADLTGLSVLELVALKPERLVVHALLVRVTADLSVPDGPNYEVLGINLRGMVERIHTAHLQAHMPAIIAVFDEEKRQAADFVAEQLAARVFDRPSAAATPAQSPSLLQRWFGSKSTTERRAASTEEPLEIIAIREWKAQLADCVDPLQRACLTALIKTVDAIVGHRGRVIPDRQLIRDIVVNQVANTHGAQVLEAFIEPLWQHAVEAEGYRLLPAREKPVIMNVKGASASGKSTIRPQQRELSGKLGIPWEDFALISPDYWRKYLLDYTSLGEDYKYGAMLTGRELEIIDRKLDQYMASKASQGRVSHMLIDRFRFDSFNAGSETTADSKLLSRFGDRVFLFFMVTHPANTVERAWLRGIQTGRFKAVDDLLYHNVEAFTGMPALFLSWVNSKDKQIHFEFLDNDVALGELPRTGAFGWNGSMTILDVRLLLNIDRFRNVNISAKTADDVLLADADDSAGKRPFIVSCCELVPFIQFADRSSAVVYATVINGRLHWWDQEYIQQHADAEGLLKTLQLLGYDGNPCPRTVDAEPTPIDVQAEKRATVGDWYTDSG
ncbi:MAG: hypothetical protein HKN42_04970 [Granulosicoccus sp.]|nr:hypothetical protein [Granulosicoccus sp.]